MHRDAFGENFADQHNHLTDRQFHHRAGVGVRRVEYRHAAFGRRFEVDLVGADAKGTDCHQAVGVFQHLFGQVRFGSDTDDGDVFDSLTKFVLIECPFHELHVKAFVLESFQRGRMDIFQ